MKSEGHMHLMPHRPLDLRPIKLAILSSGNGSNAENIIQFCTAHKERLQVCVLISDRPQALCLEKAQREQILSFAIPFTRAGFTNIQAAKEAHEQKILAFLQEMQVQWVLLAGYMRILSGNFLRHFYEESWKVARVVNIHPALLPSFTGVDAYEQAYFAGVKYAGVTLHFVDEGIDTGPILLQRSFVRSPLQSLADFKAAGMQLEYELYRKFLQGLADDKIQRLKLQENGVEGQRPLFVVDGE